MNLLGACRRAVVALSSMIALSNCAGLQAPIENRPLMSSGYATRVMQAEGRDSWMIGDAKKNDLLYISNVNTVTVYTYPIGKRVGTLRGFYRTGGECSDMLGNVFISDFGHGTMVEYPHGDKRPIQSFTLSGHNPVDCSVDAESGDLAITWNKNGSSTNYIAVYQHATGTPTLYGLKGTFVYYCGYDNKGNLFVDGQVGYNSQSTVFVELPSGGTKLKNITLNRVFQHVGAVQWDGKYVAIGDDVAQNIYRFAISGERGTLKGTVSLGTATSVSQWWISGKRVIGPNGSNNTVYYWGYPTGGTPTKSITDGVLAPYGATVSKSN